jgi:hypothetical protein
MDYRLYFHGHDGRFAKVAEFTADDDETAITTAESLTDGRIAELWQQARMVQGFAANASERRG